MKLSGIFPQLKNAKFKFHSQWLVLTQWHQLESLKLSYLRTTDFCCITCWLFYAVNISLSFSCTLKLYIQQGRLWTHEMLLFSSHEHACLSTSFFSSSYIKDPTASQLIFSVNSLQRSLKEQRNKFEVSIPHFILKLANKNTVIKCTSLLYLALSGADLFQSTSKIKGV